MKADQICKLSFMENDYQENVGNVTYGKATKFMFTLHTHTFICVCVCVCVYIQHKESLFY